jgi:hypothetical protein
MYQKIGLFTVSGGRVIISDPVYMNCDTLSRGFSALNGLWAAYVSYISNMKYLYINQLVIVNNCIGVDLVDKLEADKKILNLSWSDTDESISVDSGQVIVFDNVMYAVCQRFVYDIAYHSTYNLVKGAECFISGCLSNSGLGDGTYPIFTSLNEEKEEVALKVIF